ncbi:MAG: rod shape-determining protein RodA [Gemmataceae bacterium]|nr:rod shape-determining protein RodA [Gemmataceae bacterium]
MPRVNVLPHLDWWMIGAALAITLAGLMMIFSTGYGSPAHDLFRRQLVWLLVGVALMLVIAVVDYHTWAEFSALLYGLSMLVLLLTPFLARPISGARSWLEVGHFRLQPSEAAKLTTLLAAAAYLARKKSQGLRLQHQVILSGIVLLPVGLTLLQPDLGTATTYLPLFAVLVWLSGIRMRTLVILGLLAVLALPVLWSQFLLEHQRERVLSFLDPSRDPKGSGYQAMQSKIAVGSGGLWGKGLFSGTQSQLKFLPEQHTDFIFAVLAEEGGFLGSFSVLTLYFVLIARLIQAARTARDRLGIYLCMGAAGIMGAQIFANIGVVIGLLPTAGIPLPLMSYGGSSLIATLCTIGMVINVHWRRFVN